MYVAILINIFLFIEDLVSQSFKICLLIFTNSLNSSVLVIYCCIANHYKSQWLKTIMILYYLSQSLLFQNPRAAQFLLGISHEAAVPRLLYCYMWCVTWENSNSSIFMWSLHMVSLSWQTQESQNSYMMTQGARNSCPQRRELSDSHSTFYDLTSEVIQYYMQHTLSESQSQSLVQVQEEGKQIASVLETNQQNSRRACGIRNISVSLFGKYSYHMSALTPRI